MSNNIYNILGKLASLTPKQEESKTTEVTYETVEAKGSVLEGVARVEKKLAEQLAAIKEAPAYDTTKNYGMGQQSDGKFVHPGQKFDTATGKPLAVRPFEPGRTTQAGGTAPADVAADKLARMVQLRDAYAKRGDAQRAQYVQDQIRLFKAGQPYDEAFFGGMSEDEVSEGEITKTEKGMRHRGTYGTEYQGDSDEEEQEQKKADNGEKTRGRPRKHAKKDTSGEKKVRGRPSKKDSEKSSAHLPWGGKPPKASDYKLPDWPKDKVTKHRIKDESIEEKAVNPYAVGMAQAMKSTGDKPPLKKSTITKAHSIAKKVKTTESKLAERFMAESRLMDDAGETLEHILSRFKAEVKKFQNNEDLDMDLYYALYDYYFDRGDIPYGTAKGRDGDPYEWVTQRLDQDLAELAEGADPEFPTALRANRLTPQSAKVSGYVGKYSVGTRMFNDYETARKEADLKKLPIVPVEQPSDTNPTADLGEELNELARLAGLAAEGNAFTGKLAQTKKGDKFELGGKEFVDLSDLDEAKANKDYDGDGEIESSEDEYKGSKDKAIKKAMNVKESQLDECGDMSPIGSMAQGMDQDNLNITASYNSKDGKKTVNVSAEGEQAEQLAQILKLSGLMSGQAEETQPEVKVVAISPEQEEVEEERDVEYANTPEEEVEGVDAIVHQGNDLNREKQQDPATANKAANPLAKESFDLETMGLGAKLMKAYESIKLQK